MQTSDLVKLSEVRRLAATGEARRIRLAARLSLGDMAGSLGVYESTISRWERGERLPRGTLALQYGRMLESVATASKVTSA